MWFAAVVNEMFGCRCWCRILLVVADVLICVVCCWPSLSFSMLSPLLCMRVAVVVGRCCLLFVAWCSICVVCCLLFALCC